MRLCLVIENGKSKGRRVEVPFDGSLIAGRDPEAGLRLPDSMVSRQHFRVSHDVDGCVLEDLGSQNGTFLNDERAEGVQTLSVGDMIHVGETTLSLLEMESKGLIGREIAGHRILDRVGRGGMGTVFRANQLSLSREVAFKILSAKLLEDETFVDLFFKEARAAGALNHPNIVQVYDVGRDQGLYYFSMEFMPHGSVQDRLNREGKIPWNEAAKIVLDAARGLQYAQRKNIVHRDIKPDNLMFAEDGSVKIADLGLAHRTDEGEPGSEGILGTPHFISPEQAQGKPVDVRSDLYSLGASFYRMVAGRNPFHGRKVREIILAQIKEQPTPVYEVDPTVPKEIGAVIDRMMAKDPDDRYQKPEELVEALEHVWSPTGTAGGGGNGVKVGIGIGAVALLAIIAFFVFKKGDPPKPDPQPTGPVASGPTGPDPNGGDKPDTPDTPKGPDPKEVQRNRELAAQVEYLNLQNDRAVKGAERIERLTALAKKHAGTEFGAKAAADSKQLVADAERARKAAAERRTTVQADWDQVSKSVERLQGESRFAAAHHRVEMFLKDHTDADKLGFGDPARQRLTKIAQTARSSYEALRKKADALAAAESFDRAIAALDEFVGRVADAEAPHKTYRDLLAEANRARKFFRSEKLEAQSRRFMEDRKRLIAAQRAAHAAVRRYAFPEALAALEKARGETASKSYKARYTAPVDFHRGLVALRAELIRRANDRKGLQNRRVPLDVVMVGKADGNLVKADERFLHVQVVISGRKNVFKRAWSGYGPEKYLALYTDDRWQMKPIELKAVAFLASAFGRFDVAGDFARQSGEATVIDWVERESKASNLLEQAVRAKTAQSWGRLRQLARQLRQDFADTWVSTLR